MRVAQVAPLFESVPPRQYGGTERVVAYLTEELVNQGHEVTLFASGDSHTRAELVPCTPRALRGDAKCIDPVARHLAMHEQVFRRLSDFDLVHFHTDYLQFPLIRRHRATAVTTLHGRLDVPDLVPVYREFSDVPLVSISDAQRKPLEWVNWVGTVHHGLPLDLYPFRPQPDREQYLAFVGRISPEKRLDRAIRIAREVGLPLKVAAKLDGADADYYQQRIRPLLREPGVEFIGEVGDRDKAALLGGALALIFPIDWPEPFGLVMIEALACGTPVVAYRGGSVSEVIDDGLTGWVVEDLREAIRACQRLTSIDRRICRKVFERRFTSARMTEDYLDIYEKLMMGPHLTQLAPRRYALERSHPG